MDIEIKNIATINFMGKLSKFGGGGVHLAILKEKWLSKGILVNEVRGVEAPSFTLLNILRATVRSMTINTNSLSKFGANDIIISASPYPPDVILAHRLSRRFRKPMTIYVHHIPPGFFFHPFRRGIFRVALNRIYILLLLAFAVFYRVPIFLDNPNTIGVRDLTVFPDLDAVSTSDCGGDPLPNLNKTVDICCIGRIQKSKGVEDLIKVVRILVREYHFTPKVVLAGKGEDGYVKKIRKLIDYYGLSNDIILKGFISDREKIELLRNSKVFIFLSYEEGWSLSVMEAASCGLPIVAYDLPAYYYLEGNYFSIRPSDIRQCAEVTIKVISEYESSSKTGRKAQELISKFSYNFISNQQLIFFEKIIKEYWNFNNGF